MLVYRDYAGAEEEIPVRDDLMTALDEWIVRWTKRCVGPVRGYFVVRGAEPAVSDFRGIPIEVENG